MLWADLLARTWNINALRCPYCGGRMRVICAVHDPDAIAAIIAAVHLADARALEVLRHQRITHLDPPLSDALSDDLPSR